MELNGGLAFGAALAGGALFGPMGAFMALPVAAMIYAFVTNYRTHKYEVAFTSPLGDEPPNEAVKGT
jgi:predicted PurR-regulated permease PerM